MNHNIKFVAVGISVLALFSSISVSASTLTNFDVETKSVTSTNFQAGTSGSLSSTSTNTSLTSYSGSGVATATATASDTGVTTASVSGLIQPGDSYGLPESSTHLDLSAVSYYSIALTNDFAYSIDFTYDYLIDPSYIELASNFVGSGAKAKSSVIMNLNGDYTTEIVNLQWYNTGFGEVFSTTGDATLTESSDGSFRYDLAAVAGTFNGTLAIGETVTISTMIEAYVYGNMDSGTVATDFIGSVVVGGRAFAGDPNGLSISGFGITPTVSAVPLPASAWFFATGLLGLFGMSKRKRA